MLSYYGFDFKNIFLNSDIILCHYLLASGCSQKKTKTKKSEQKFENPIISWMSTELIPFNALCSFLSQYNNEFIFHVNSNKILLFNVILFCKWWYPALQLYFSPQRSFLFEKAKFCWVRKKAEHSFLNLQAIKTVISLAFAKLQYWLQNPESNVIPKSFKGILSV